MANRICREKYCSYGSYLRSRGYDKEICNLVTAIENGQIPLGPINPSGTCGVTISGTTTIQNCSDLSSNNYDGILRITGGSDTNPNAFSLVANHGINLLGPVLQNYGTDISYSFGGNTYHGNRFSAPQHIFTSNDASTNVIIQGSLYVQGGSVVDVSSQSILESIEINTVTGLQGNSLRIFHSPSAIGNIIRVDTDISSVVGTGSWERYEAIVVDGTDGEDGGTNAQGHLRALRGITVMNPPASGQPIDMSYNLNWTGTDNALEVLGKLSITDGNNSASAAIDLSGGRFTLLNGSQATAWIDSSGDASFNSVVTNDLVSTDISATNISSTQLNTTNLVAEDLSAQTIHTSKITPLTSGVYGISYESLSNTRQRYLFGEGFVLGDISGQRIPAVGTTTTTVNSQYLVVEPSQLKINAYFDSNIMRTISGPTGSFLALDVSNNKDAFINSLTSFNSTLQIGSTNTDKLQQTVLFLHPNNYLDCYSGTGVNDGAGYWPNDASGDIIIDTRSIGTLPNGFSGTLTYGTRNVYTGASIPASHNGLSGEIYIPHIAFKFQNNSSFELQGGNLSMNQRVFN